MSTNAAFLHNVPLFAHLSTSELQPLSERLVTRRFRSKEVIFDQGSPGNSLYIVKTGLIAIVVTPPDGPQQIIAHFGPGQTFGEFSLLDGLPRSAGAVALEKSEVLILPRAEFFLYLERCPTVAISLLVLISRRLRFALQRTEHEAKPQTVLVQLAHLLIQLAERYGRANNNQIQLPLRLTQGELAGMMGCSRLETENALNTLYQRRIVEIRGSQLTIFDIEALRAAACDATVPELT